MHAKVSQAFQVFDMGIAPQMKCSYFLDVQFIILIVRCHFSLWTLILKNCKFVSCSPPQICSISTSTFSPCNFVGSKPIGCMCNLSIKINIKKLYQNVQHPPPPGAAANKKEKEKEQKKSFLRVKKGFPFKIIWIPPAKLLRFTCLDGGMNIMNMHTYSSHTIQCVLCLP